MTELRTSRLVLRRPRTDDSPHYSLGIGEFAVARWLTQIPWPYSLAMATEWLGGATGGAPERNVLIIELPGKGLIGSISIMDEMAFWIARPHWGRGYAVEACTAMLDWHFSCTNREHVTASTHHDNRAGLRVQAKLGFAETGRDRRFSGALQHSVEHVVTRLERSQWQARENVECA